MRTLAMPKTVERWSMTSLRVKLIKIGAKVVSHGRYVTFQLAEVAVPRRLFAAILSLIARLRPAARAGMSGGVIMRQAAIGEICAGVPKSLYAALSRPRSETSSALCSG